MKKNLVYSLGGGLATAAIFILLAILIPKINLLLGVVLAAEINSREVIKIMEAIISSWSEINSVWARRLLGIGTALAGLQGGMTVYRYLQAKKLVNSGKSCAAILAGSLGAGCVACGSFILGSLLGLGAANIILSYLPYEGLEFGILGIGILLAMVIITWAQIKKEAAQ
ncbi:MAG: hypothetical protein UV54_C0017G0005 [Candidatus Beckwithbacteria bacterium GW2011_GWA2_43_10]|uniref:Uncharacterized protein n=1 Tax=Candidatus Beckwithbacteria bacterium GW2011_GWA2_43_10 TaxID=1618369 RepID=A0A0G1C3N4_9BACT|nr:MAG: hypothetical protein UV54_C0017G0005 [Candidatus Beckwithbacteria bacterium GW2011_GWA2_43_10]